VAREPSQPGLAQRRAKTYSRKLWFFLAFCCTRM
jgi:hypothetical protein